MNIIKAIQQGQAHGNKAILNSTLGKFKPIRWFVAHQKGLTLILFAILVGTCIFYRILLASHH